MCFGSLIVIFRMAADRMLGLLVLLCYFLLLLSAANGTEYQAKCPESFCCGELGEIRFPFTNTSTECGLPLMGCDNPFAPKEVLLEIQRRCKIERILPDNSIYTHDTEFRELLHYKECSAFTYPILPAPALMSLHILNNMTFFRCNRDPDPYHGTSRGIFKYDKCSDFDIYYANPAKNLPSSHDEFSSFLSSCKRIQLPVNRWPNISNDPFTFLSDEIHIQITLSESCQQCSHGGGQNMHCDDSYDNEHNGRESRDPKKAAIIGLSIGLAGMATIALLAILLLYKRRQNSSDYQNKPRNIYSGSNAITNVESGTVYFGIPVFPYEELQEATNNFDQARELGEGGFGTVYYGKLRDGREVAVKRLFERNYKPVESFINEIQILTRLRHTNLVSLYGCTSRHSRELLLVYEYIPNGTVNYHIHGDNGKPGSLPWPVRMKIAIETASALAYLHASDIIHRDVKTSNILLDNNFNVKVADFGLSRLFPNDVTHVSTAPRGTPGYVDPDYRICYQLTSKSDVYSFGVVLVELISSMPAVDLTRDRDEIKLANLALRKIQKGAFCELVDPSLCFPSDNKLKRMIISVAELAFQCLQGDKELRPSMAQVLEVLQRIESGQDEPGNLEGIDVHGAGSSHSYVHPSLPKTMVKPQRLHQTY